MLSRFREPVNALTHFFAALLAVIGLAILVSVGPHDALKEISLGVYGGTLILLFAASAAYHMARAKPKMIQSLRKLDHAAIYLLIAGTYTPFCVLMFKGFWHWGFLAIIWFLAILGIVVKMFIIEAPRWLSAGIYIMMGWLSIAAVGEMLRVLPSATIVWLIIGGIVYTIGGVIYISRIFDFYPGKFGFHEVWHIFVILGALAHFIAISLFVVPYGI
jgi:hemolysin III